MSIKSTSKATDRIEKQIELRAPVERVWKALTDVAEFGKWFGVNMELPFVVGQRAYGQITHPGYEHVTMQVVVERMERPHRFAFRWHPYAVDPGVDYSQEQPTLVEFALESTSEGTLLKVCESGFDAIPSWRRDEAFRMNDGGWSAQLQNIVNYVTGNP